MDSPAAPLKRHQLAHKSSKCLRGTTCSGWVMYKFAFLNNKSKCNNRKNTKKKKKRELPEAEWFFFFLAIKLIKWRS